MIPKGWPEETKRPLCRIPPLETRVTIWGNQSLGRYFGGMVFAVVYERVKSWGGGWPAKMFRTMDRSDGDDLHDDLEDNLQ